MSDQHPLVPADPTPDATPAKPDRPGILDWLNVAFSLVVGLLSILLVGNPGAPVSYPVGWLFVAFGLVVCLANVVHAIKRSRGAGEYVIGGGLVVIGVGMLIAAPWVWLSGVGGTIWGVTLVVGGMVRLALRYRKDRRRRPA